MCCEYVCEKEEDVFLCVLSTFFCGDRPTFIYVCCVCTKKYNVDEKKTDVEAYDVVFAILSGGLVPHVVVMYVTPLISTYPKHIREEYPE